MSDHEGPLGDPEAPAEGPPIATREYVRPDPRRDDRDGRSHPALLEQAADCPARCDDRITEVAVARDQIDREALECLRVSGDIVGVLLIQGVVGENQRQIAGGGDAERGAAEQEGVVGVDHLGPEGLEAGQEPERFRHRDREIAAVEVAYRREAHHVALAFRAAFEQRCRHQHPMAETAEGVGVPLDTARHPPHVRREGIGHHQDVHQGRLGFL